MAFARRRKFKEEKSLSRKLYLIYRFFAVVLLPFSAVEEVKYIVAPKNDKVLNCLSGTIFYISLPAFLLRLQLDFPLDLYEKFFFDEKNELIEGEEELFPFDLCLQDFFFLFLLFAMMPFNECS